MKTINIAQKFSQFHEPWSPKIVGEINDSYVKAVRFQGEFVWHHHDNEDEMFLVVKGRFRMEFRESVNDAGELPKERDVWLEEGEFIVVPRGVEHRPVADEEAEVLLFEPASTLNTGNVQDKFTVSKLEWL
jgi:mannose-6-phosphate isomerase-like protein (cupin superfamily)